MAKNDKQIAFAHEYVKDYNGTQAAIRAGYSPNTARVQSADLLTKPNVQKIIAEYQTQTKEATKITLERIVQEAARIALFDPRNLFNADGSPKSISDLDDDTAASISSIDASTSMGDGGQITRVLKYKASDKNRAIDILMKHLGGYKEDNEQKADPVKAFLAAICGNVAGVVKEPLPTDEDEED